MEPARNPITDSVGSSPTSTKVDEPSKPAPAKAPVGTVYHLKSEQPSAPANQAPALAQMTSDDLSSGNHAYTLELKERGHLGLFFDRSQTVPRYTTVEIVPDQFYSGIRLTLAGALRRLLTLKSEIVGDDLTTRVNNTADTLARGCVLIAYLKVQAYVVSELPSHQQASSLRRPKVAMDLPIPAPFAFAIQQLGIVRGADQVKDCRYAPVFPTTGHTYGLPAGQKFNAHAYAEAMEYARSLGMRFAVVDLKVKNGSAWWLFRQYFSEEMFELQCVIPEANYTESMAVTHTLWLNPDEDDPSCEFVDLSDFADTEEYGIMLTAPTPGINITTFEAIGDTAQEVWTTV